MEIRHFILDLDGTLWDTSEISAEAYNQALRKDGRCGLVVTPQIIKREFGKTFRDIADDLFPDFELLVRDELMTLCALNNNRLLEETDNNMLYPDIRSTMEALSKNCRLYIVSNCEAGYIELFLTKYNLEPFITDIECLGNTGYSKAGNIRLVMERNQIEKAVYVGDTAGDYHSAAEAGIPFIFAAYGYGTVPGDCPAINHFSDLLA